MYSARAALDRKRGMYEAAAWLSVPVSASANPKGDIESLGNFSLILRRDQQLLLYSADTSSHQIFVTGITH